MTVLAGAVRRGRPAQAGAAPARRHAAIDRRCRWLARAGAVLIGLLIALLAGGALNAELDAVASGRSASASADLADLAGAMADQEAALRAPAPPALDRARAASDAARTELGRATLATGRGGLADRTAADAGAWEAWADAQRREAASGRPAAAHTTSWAIRSRSMKTGTVVACPNGGTPPIA